MCPLRGQSLESRLAAQSSVRRAQGTVAAAKTCTYCGGTASTDDHVPPRRLFARPWPADLITVPSCQSCNGGAKKDDEYFIWALTCSASAVGDEAARARSQRFKLPVPPHRRTMVNRLWRSYLPVMAVTPAGLAVGMTAGYRVETERLHRVLARIVRGLYFHETKERVAGAMKVFTSFEPPTARERAVVRGFLHENERTIARGAFRYSLVPHPQISGLTVCPMVFFEDLLAIGRVEKHA